jgi:NAD(P)-dependent dehydrogenase (short-subunit alcohol dehydrogenase family)
MDLGLANATAVVIGGSRGMGRATARCLADEGARVAVVGRSRDALDSKHFGHPAHLPRAGLPEEIGPVVAFLASRRNSYMTGANINVDGGSDFT